MQYFIIYEEDVKGDTNTHWSIFGSLFTQNHFGCQILFWHMIPLLSCLSLTPGPTVSPARSLESNGGRGIFFRGFRLSLRVAFSCGLEPRHPSQTVLIWSPSRRFSVKLRRWLAWSQVFLSSFYWQQIWIWESRVLHPASLWSFTLGLLPSPSSEKELRYAKRKFFWLLAWVCSKSLLHFTQRYSQTCHS